MNPSHPIPTTSFFAAPARPALAVLLLVAASLQWGCSPGSGAPPFPDLSDGGAVTAFVGVHVLPMDREWVLENQTVVVQDGVIRWIGPAGAARLPADADRIQQEGAYLMPGLSEMHAHVPGPEAPPEDVQRIFDLYLSNGITTIRGMLGAPNQLELREALRENRMRGPNFYVAAPSLNPSSAPDAETAAALVRAHHAAGYDLLKLHPGLSRRTYDRIVETANDVGITWAGHISTDVGLEYALGTRQSTIDHLDGYVEAVASRDVRYRLLGGDPVPLREIVDAASEERIRELARRTAVQGVWNVPTAYLWELFYNDVPAQVLAARPEMEHASSAQIAQWTDQKENRTFVDLLEGWRSGGELGAEHVSQEDADRLIELRRRILRALYGEGAPMLLGTDSPQMFMVPGHALHREVALMAELGIPPFRILESGTRNVGRYVRDDLGLDETFGLVAPGHRADLILLRGNPLEELSLLQDPIGVMVRGMWEEVGSRDGLPGSSSASTPR